MKVEGEEYFCVLFGSKVRSVQSDYSTVTFYFSFYIFYLIFSFSFYIFYLTFSFSFYPLNIVNLGDRMYTRVLLSHYRTWTDDKGIVG